MLPMHPVFQRYTLNLDSSLEELLAQPETELGLRLRSVARNVMHDHRVSPPREDSFRTYTVREPKLPNALRQYYNRHVRTSQDAHFLDLALSGDNWVAGAPTKVDLIDPDTPLLRVVNLNGEREAFQWGTREWTDPRNDRFFEIAGARSDTEFHEAIGRQLLEDAEAFISVWLDMRKARRSSLKAAGAKKFDGPVWAMFAKAFLDDVDPGKDGPDRWFEVVGVHPDTAPVWAILLQYPLRKAGTVARPTILDAGGYPWHFPSPPGADVDLGGFMMDLCIDPPCDHLRSEFIHETIDFEFEYREAAGSRYGETTRTGRDGIGQQRTTHHALLNRRYDDVMSWMPQCV
jgi:hypothetical protein